MKKLIYFISFICFTITSTAQINEIGVFVGGANYVGDIGSEYYINPNNFMGGVIYKYNLNPRMALRGTFTYALHRLDLFSAAAPLSAATGSLNVEESLQRIKRYGIEFTRAEMEFLLKN